MTHTSVPGLNGPCQLPSGPSTMHNRCCEWTMSMTSTPYPINSTTAVANATYSPTRIEAWRNRASSPARASGERADGVAAGAGEGQGAGSAGPVATGVVVGAGHAGAGDGAVAPAVAGIWVVVGGAHVGAGAGW